jgi:hypothetical protein
MNDEGLADVGAANPFRLPRNHPGIDLPYVADRHAHGDPIAHVRSGGPTLCTLAPDMLRELLLPRQRRAKRHGRISESTQSEGSQFQSFICANPPNLYGHLSLASSVTRSSRPSQCVSVVTMTSMLGWRRWVNRVHFPCVPLRHEDAARARRKAKPAHPR